MTAKRTHDSVRRALRLMKALRGHALRGLSNAELAKALGESPVNVTRYVDTLVEEGWATRLEDGRITPGIAFLQFAMATTEELDRAGARLTEMRARISTNHH
ncbi:TPA: helix-turn-helix domain-containing protein [Pseudomonas aeruginosa]|nr:helix-turn-helix domain-containing protein [Pseudomonas aeruginosa]